METRRFALDPKKRWLALPALFFVLAAGCSSSMDNRPRPAVRRARPAAAPGPSAAKSGKPDMATMHQAAKAAPREFEPVYTYAKALADAALLSLVETACTTCSEEAARYKRRSELEPRYWPLIDEALAMLETLARAPGLDPEQTDQLVATKGRLLWLAGRSLEEQPLIDDYAKAHPEAVAVVRRRLELLREAGATASSEAQCALSRAKTDGAAEAVRVDLLTACVALHPRNTKSSSDIMDYQRFLPNLTKSEEGVYRANLVQRCVDKVGDEDTRCEDACACDDKDSGKKPDAKCKKTCGGCRSETAQKLHLCKKIAEAPSVAVRTAPPKPAAAPPPPEWKLDAPAPRPKSAPHPAHQKGRDSGLKQMEL